MIQLKITEEVCGENQINLLLLKVVFIMLGKLPKAGQMLCQGW